MKLFQWRSWNPGSAFLGWSFCGSELPEDLAEDAEGEIGISGGEVQAGDEAAYFFLRGGSGPPLLRVAGIRFQITACTECVEQKSGEALEIGGRGGGGCLPIRGGLWCTRVFA